MMETSQRLETLNFSSKLLTWWDSNGRRFLWRETDDLYAIFLSEILLHRTRAEQVLPVYVRFIEEFPTLDDLSNAELDLVTHILQPIGLRWRTTLLVKAVKLMVSKHAGKIPSFPIAMNLRLREENDFDSLPRYLRQFILFIG